MPSLEYFLVAKNAIVDQSTNRVSINEVVDEITPRRYPFIIGRLVMISGWNSDAAEQGSEFTIQLTAGSSSIEHQMIAERPRLRYVHHYIGLLVEKPGELVISVALNSVEVAHHRILLSAADPSVPPDGWLFYSTPPASAPTAEPVKISAV